MVKISVDCSSFHSVPCVHFQSITRGFQHHCSQNKEPLLRRGAEVSPTAVTGQSVPSCSGCGISSSFPAKIHDPSQETQASSRPCYALCCKSNTTKSLHVLGQSGILVLQHSMTQYGKGFGVPLLLHAKGLQCLADLLSPANFHHGNSREEYKKWGSHTAQRSSSSNPWLGTIKAIALPCPFCLTVTNDLMLCAFV